MKYHLKVSTILVVLSHSIAAVIPGDASVQTDSGVKMLHEVMVGERVLSANREMDGLAHERVLMNQCAGRRNSTIQINLGKRRIKAAPDQLFFDPLKEDWIKAEDLTAENALFGDDLQPINILDVKRKSGLAMKTRMVNIAAVHQLYVDGVLTHNMDKVWAALGQGIVIFTQNAIAGAGLAAGGDAWHAGVEVARQSLEGTYSNGRDGAGAGHQAARSQNAQMVSDLSTGCMPTTKAEFALGTTPLRNPVDCAPQVLDPRMSIAADGTYRMNMDSGYTPPQLQSPAPVPAPVNEGKGSQLYMVPSSSSKPESTPGAAPRAAAKAAPAPVTKAAAAPKVAAPVKQAPAPAPKAVQAAPKVAAPVVQQVAAPVAGPTLRQLYELNRQKQLASQAAAPQVAPQEAPKVAKRRNLF